MKKLLVFFLLSGILHAQGRPDALASFRRGNYEEAVNITLAELKDNPQNMDSYTVLGWSLNQLKRYQESVRYATQALEIRRYDFRILEIIGEALFYLNRHAEAITYLQQYTAIAPAGDRIGRVYYFMGESFIQLGEYTHADVALTTSVYFNPETARWWERLGFARAQAKDWRFAQKAFQEAFRLAPTSPEARSGLDQATAMVAQAASPSPRPNP